MPNPYLNTPPTEIVRLLKKETDPTKKTQMGVALNAWREVTGNPLAKSAQDLFSKRISTRYLKGDWVQSPPPGFLERSLYRGSMYR